MSSRDQRQQLVPAMPIAFDPMIPCSLDWSCPWRGWAQVTNGLKRLESAHSGIRHIFPVRSHHMVTSQDSSAAAAPARSNDSPVWQTVFVITCVMHCQEEIIGKIAASTASNPELSSLVWLKSGTPLRLWCGHRNSLMIQMLLCRKFVIFSCMTTSWMIHRSKLNVEYSIIMTMKLPLNSASSI